MLVLCSSMTMVSPLAWSTIQQACKQSHLFVSTLHKASASATSVSYVSDRFTCAICQSGLLRPVRLNCHHVFCQDCWDVWSLESLEIQLNADSDSDSDSSTVAPHRSCPSCRQPQHDTPQRLPDLELQLKSEPVTCSHRDVGCNWSGSAKE